MRGRITYANVAATLALVFSMSGGALAANHYLINSTKQINPKVLKKLQGHNGRSGTKGTTGPAGAAGPTGSQGLQGSGGVQGGAGPQGPGASQLKIALPASASPSFTNVGTIQHRTRSEVHGRRDEEQGRARNDVHGAVRARVHADEGDLDQRRSDGHDKRTLLRARCTQPDVLRTTQSSERKRRRANGTRECRGSGTPQRTKATSSPAARVANATRRSA